MSPTKEMPQKEVDLGLEAPENHVTQFATAAETSLLDRLIVLADHKKLIFWVVGVAAAVSIVVSLLLPKTYEANAKIMPPQQSTSTASAMMAQLGPLAMLAGNQLGLKNPSDLYVAMLRSRTVADALIQRFNLMQVYDLKKIKDTRLRLANWTEISLGPKDGVISVTVTDRDPQRAADLANAYVEELEKLTRTLAVTEAGKRRLFYEGQLGQSKDELANAEIALKQAQEKSGMIQLDAQARAIISGLGELKAAIVAKQAEIHALRSFATEANPQLTIAEKELEGMQAELKRAEQQNGSDVFDMSLKNIPEAGLTYIRAMREFKYRETLYELMAKQYEIARLDEAKDAAIIQVLDKGVPAADKAGPHRALIVLLSVFLAFWAAVAWILVRSSLEEAKADPELAGRLARLKASLQATGRNRSAGGMVAGE